MTRTVVISAPRSGTHMLVRMIARAAKSPWAIAVTTDVLKVLPNDSWVVGCHAPVDQVKNCVDSDVRIVCIWRSPFAHAESLDRIGLGTRSEYLAIMNSMEPSISVSYESIVQKDASELRKVEALCGALGIKTEPREHRYDASDLNWAV